MRNDKQNVIVEITFQFALDIIEFSELLEENRKYIVARQVLRAAFTLPKSPELSKPGSSPT